MTTTISIWAILLALSALSYLSAESLLGTASAIILLGTAMLKSVLVGFHFMDLGRAHLVWRAGFISLLSIFSVFAVIVLAA